MARAAKRSTWNPTGRRHGTRSRVGGCSPRHPAGALVRRAPRLGADLGFALTCVGHSGPPRGRVPWTAAARGYRARPGVASPAAHVPDPTRVLPAGRHAVRATWTGIDTHDLCACTMNGVSHGHTGVILFHVEHSRLPPPDSAHFERAIIGPTVSPPQNTRHEDPPGPGIPRRPRRRAPPHSAASSGGLTSRRWREPPAPGAGPAHAASRLPRLTRPGVATIPRTARPTSLAGPADRARLTHHPFHPFSAPPS